MPKRELNSWTNGAVSQYIASRNDLDKYGLSCEELENFMNLPYGAIERRNGSLYIRDLTSFSTYSGELYTPKIDRFKFSNSEVYTIVFGHKKIYIRDANDVASILDSTKKVETTIYNASTSQEIPWEYDELDDIKLRQSADVLYIVHPLHPPHKLSRTGSATAGFTFTCEEIEFVGGPFEPYNTDSTLEVKVDMNPSGTGADFIAAGTTGVTVTDPNNDDIFENMAVGDYLGFKVKRTDMPTEINFTATAEAEAIHYVKGAWEFTTSGTWTDTLHVFKHPDPNKDVPALGANETEALANFISAGWEKIYSLTSGNDRNYIKTSESIDYETIAFYHSRAKFDIDFQGVKDFISTLKVTEWTNPNLITCKAITPVWYDGKTATTTSYHWAYGSWSSARGYPSVIEFHDQRLYYGSTVSSPNAIWGSEVSDFENFDLDPPTQTDSSAVSYTLLGGDVVSVKWLTSQQELIAGTDGGLFTIKGSGVNSPITPTSIIVNKQDNIASGDLDGRVAGDAIIYAQSNGKKIRAAIYSDSIAGYQSEDLNLINNELLKDGVQSMSYQQIPEPYIWVVSNDGNIYGMAYNRAQSIFGWNKYTTDGDYKGVVITPTVNDDRMWLLVERTINGNKKLYLERIYHQTNMELKYAVQADCAAITTTDGVTVEETIWSVT